jgi:hypothetical protein
MMQARTKGMLRGCGLALALLAGMFSLVACAPPQPIPATAGRAQLALPQGDWMDLGVSNETLPSSIAFPGGPPMQTRAVGLRGPQQELLAVLLIQSNLSNLQWNRTLWTGACPAQQDMFVEDAARASPVRIDCLRFKRWASSNDWLKKSQPALAQWLGERQLAPRQPYSYLSYRYTTEAGAYVAINAVVDHRLLAPRTHNNDEFLVSGQPALKWSQQVAQAARISAGMLDGHLAIPAFPIALPN